MLEIICNKLHGKIEQIKIDDFQELLNHLFCVKELIFNQDYNAIIKSQEESI